MQMRIPCVLMRGGTSRGPFFLASDLPADIHAVDRILIAAMGSPHPLQIDGVGGGNSLSSKVAIVSRSTVSGVDLDYLFVQVNVATASVDRNPNCGNMLSAVGPFALDAGLVEANGEETSLCIRNINSGTIVEAVVQTPGGVVDYEGDTSIDGVPGTAAPIKLSFRDAIGSVTGQLLPAKQARSVLEGIEMTLIDAAVPLMIIRAEDVGLTGSELPEEIDSNRHALDQVEALRRKAGLAMGMGDVAGKVTPKVALVAPSRQGGTVLTRYLTPLTCHRSLAVTGAITIATSLFVPGSVTSDLLKAPIRDSGTVRIEHPSGSMLIEVVTGPSVQGGIPEIQRSSLIRTARRLFEGNIMVPGL
jgi:2-methylaconitate cis-trans-isomerase PrpF